MIVCCLTLASCGSRPSAPRTDAAATADQTGGVELPKGSTASVICDWDDVEAAAIVGTDQADCAIVRVVESSQRKWMAEILSVRDEHGTLTAFRGMNPCIGTIDELTCAHVTLVCSLGVFGNVDAERRVLDEMVERLEDLYGVEFAPVR